MAREDARGAFLVEYRVGLLDGVHLPNIGAEVNVRFLPVRRGGVNDVQWFAEAELESHRHHDARGKEGGEEIALLEAVEVAIELLAKPGRIMALREADRAGGFTHQIVLLD